MLVNSQWLTEEGGREGRRIEEFTMAVCACACVCVCTHTCRHTWHVESSQSRDRTHVPCIVRWLLIHCTTKEVQRGESGLQFLDGADCEQCRMSGSPKQNWGFERRECTQFRQKERWPLQFSIILVLPEKIIHSLSLVVSWFFTQGVILQLTVVLEM